ncbi:Translation factor pelota [Tilletia horrida]|nr:Translation factor pelota [Tilletia horrida]
MKITSRHIERDGSGRVTLIPEEDEDMYHLYNLIEPGDLVRAAAVRRVQSESNTGSIESHRVKLTLTIEVTKTAFDTSASSAPPDPTTADGAADAQGAAAANPLNALGGGGAGAGGAGAGGAAGADGVTLQVTGRVAEENHHVKMGAYHTLDLEANRSLTITKDSWDSVHLERLGEASDVGQRAEVGAVVLGDGTAVVCILTEHMTVVRQRIDVSLPRKRKGIASATDKSLARFHAQVYTAVLKLLALPALRLVILASPGFIKDTVYEFLFAEGQKRGDKALIGGEARRKFLRIHCNSPHLHSLMEVLRSPEVSAQLKDTKFAREGMLLDRFLRMLNTDELRAWYGEQHVALAAERGAVGTLLISDGLFRNADPNRRRKFVQLVEDVRKTGGEAAIFSSMHESGRQLNGLTGIAAILTYPLDVEIVEEEEREAAAAAKAAAEADATPTS